jgi:hypothetical protein
LIVAAALAVSVALTCRAVALARLRPLVSASSSPFS